MTLTGDTDFFDLIGEGFLADYLVGEGFLADFKGEDFLKGVAKAFFTEALTSEDLTEALAGDTLFMTTSLRTDLVGDLEGDREAAFLTDLGFSSTGAATSG